MAKTAFIFPGQGSQTPGMGLDFFNNYKEAKDIFQQADDLFGANISEICFSGNAEVLQKTENAQPALLTVSTAICKVMKNKEIIPDFLAGHSLGEYTALVCADVLNFETAFKLVKLRGKLMAQAGEKYPGTMVAVIGTNKNDLERDCREFSGDNSVVIANYNAPKQLVVSGYTDAIQEFSKLMKEKGRRVIKLNVSGAFHSHLMKPALEELVSSIEETYFHDAKIPVVTNVDARITKEGKEFKEKLKKQLLSPVLWEDTVKCMISCAVNKFVETGPQKVLGNLVSRIDKNPDVFSIEDTKSFEEYLSR